MRSSYLTSLTAGADIDHRGTPFTEDLLRDLLDALRDQDTDLPVLGTARFDEAVFGGAANFADAQFTQAIFSEAIFADSAGFRYTRFEEIAKFRGARFGGETSFDGAQFDGHSSFRAAVFSEAAFFA
ncbi:pentapeptide repeat-containing protein [Streptomyces olivochromogenes]|uniref:pentapeptide repeat-containing protein n=1 Tax=Streptomyces olivochromogenes TaxID=1963 RepID=UPI0036ACA131